MPIFEPYQERMIEELEDLRLKQEKLAFFLATTESGPLLDADERVLMVNQLIAMNSYVMFLTKRVQKFKPT